MTLKDSLEQLRPNILPKADHVPFLQYNFPDLLDDAVLGEKSMKKLSHHKFERAKNYLNEHGRPLERALFSFHFESGESKSVINELSMYQNSDGGFGNALEPDLRTPLSSALASGLALNILVEVNSNKSESVMKCLIDYLVKSLDREKLVWAIAPNDREKYPHAPWWKSDDIVESFRGCVANPTAELIGLLLNFDDPIPKELSLQVLTNIIEYVQNVEKNPEAFTMHDLICSLTLANSKGLPEKYREILRPLLIEFTKLIVEPDQEKWKSYGARPLWLCPNPQSIVFTDIKELVNRNLDYDIENQNDDGSWSPFWSWGDYHGETWPLAEKDWKSYLTLKTLLSLKSFERIESPIEKSK